MRRISADFRARPSNSESGRHSAGPRCIFDSPMSWEGFGQKAKAKAKAMKTAAERLRKLWKARRGKASTTCSHSQCWKSGRGASIKSSVSRSASFRIKAHRSSTANMYLDRVPRGRYGFDSTARTPGTTAAQQTAETGGGQPMGSIFWKAARETARGQEWSGRDV